MTITNQSNQVSYTGNGVATNFPFSFRIDAEEHLTVTKITIATEAEEVLSTGAYSVNGVGDDAGGSVDLTPAISSDYQLRIERVVPYTQEMDLLNQGGFLPEVIEQGLDALEMQIQQLRTAISGITAPTITTTGVADFDTKADAEAADIDAGLNFLRIAGRAAVGDFGGGLYKKAVSEPSHEGKLQSNDGAWWELAEVLVTPNMFDGGLADAIALTPNILIPAGVTAFSTTIEYPTVAPYGGGKMQGQGKETSTAFSARADASRSVVRWDGADGGTMIELDGQLGLLFEQISFVGKASVGATDRAGIGHHWKMTGSSGSGESTYFMCTFQYMDLAIKFADNIGDGTCAGMHFIKCDAQNIDTFMQVMNNQGLNYVLDHCSFNFIDRVCLFTRGGNLDVRNGNLAGCGTTNWCFEFAALDTNLYANTFRNLRVEQNTKRICKITGVCVVVFDGLTEAQTDQNVTMFEQIGGVLIIRNSKLVTNDTTNPTFVVNQQGGGSVGILIIENTQFQGITSFVFTDWINRANVNTPAVVVFRGNTFGTNFTPLPDFSTHLSWGNVVTIGQTTSNTPGKILTQFNVTRNHLSVVKIPTNTSVTIDIYIEGIQDNGTVLFSGVRRAFVTNVAGTTALADSQIIGTDYDPNPLGTLPAVSVSDSLDCIEVTCTGLAATVINWKATFIGTPCALS